jgi:hypothetical protein
VSVGGVVRDAPPPIPLIIFKLIAMTTLTLKDVKLKTWKGKFTGLAFIDSGDTEYRLYDYKTIDEVLSLLFAGKDISVEIGASKENAKYPRIEKVTV